MAISSIFRNIVLKSNEDVTTFLEAIDLSQLDKSSPGKVDMLFIENEDSLNAFLESVICNDKNYTDIEG